ncbi:FxLYD domain-containing protein [Streptomyces sp. NPDC002992]|uniref:FxLYD domain-containing protein n=1 Tax=Streptomyces sp. NPDC002992 TaxID=3154273 RepID=UPI0033A8F021
MIALVVVLIVAVLAIGGDGDDAPERRTPSSPAGERPQEENGVRGDVRITACEVDPRTTWPSAELLVTNRSSKSSDYLVHVEFVDASGKRLSEAYTSTNDVAPEQRSKVTAQSLDQVTAKVTCRIVDVTRRAS